MKTITRKTTRILCASTIAAMTLLGSVAPALTTVMAAGEGTTSGTTVAAEGDKTSSASENTISFDKKIYLDENENVPNATINYTLKARDVTDTETDAFKKEKFYNIEAGNTTLTASPTEFSANESATTTEDGKKVISEKSTINASDLVKNTSKPTVYTYTLTEEVQGAAKDFVTPEKGDTRKLNIYVGYADGSDKLSVLGYTLAVEDVTNKKDIKVTGFENKYETSDNDKDKNTFKVTKKVTGNQGDKTAKFNFTVKITGQHSKVTYTAPNDSKTEASTPEADGKVTVTTQLKNDESLVLKGLTKGATYEVVEDDSGKNGYTTTTERTTDAATKTEETVVTNNREGTIPTGIYLNHKLPFNILGVALAGGAVALIAKKRHEDALEDEDDE